MPLKSAVVTRSRVSKVHISLTTLTKCSRRAEWAIQRAMASTRPVSATPDSSARKQMTPRAPCAPRRRSRAPAPADRAWDFVSQEPELCQEENVSIGRMVWRQGIQTEVR